MEGKGRRVAEGGGGRMGGEGGRAGRRVPEGVGDGALGIDGGEGEKGWEKGSRVCGRWSTGDRWKGRGDRALGMEGVMGRGRGEGLGEG
jgi:hypothetical protein